jgi:hypothetical protein
MTCPIQIPVVPEMKIVECQLSEFLTECSSKSVISQFEWQLSTSYRVSSCVSRANNSSVRRRLPSMYMTTQQYDTVRSVLIFEHCEAQSLCQSIYNGSSKFRQYEICT